MHPPVKGSGAPHPRSASEEHVPATPAIAPLYTFDPAPALGETFEPLASGDSFRCERIVSRGAASPEGFWFEQAQPEWVLLAHGCAVIDFEHGPSRALRAGDSLLIPALRRHRVASTSADAIWIALHFDGETSPAAGPPDRQG